jgi:hypothetical protein
MVNTEFAVDKQQSLATESSKVVGQTSIKAQSTNATYQYAGLAYRIASDSLTQYQTSSLPTLNSSPKAAIEVIGQIACTTANQQSMCNSDPEGVLAYWAVTGCRIGTGFICSAPAGFCICPAFEPSLDLLPPNTSKDYAVWSAGTLRTVVQEIRSAIADLSAKAQEALNTFDKSKMSYLSSLSAYQTAVTQHSTDVHQLSALLLQLGADQTSALAAQQLLGQASQNSATASQLNDLLATRYAQELVIFTRNMAKLSHDNDALIRSSVDLVDTIQCKDSYDCQDNHGSLTFFAELGCHTSGFVCATNIDSCGCTQKSSTQTRTSTS